MENVKLCPECGAEYFAHVAECGGCEIPLVHPEELDKARTTRIEEAEDTLVCILEGPKDRLKEIAYGLKSKGVDSQVLKTVSGGSSCSTGGGFGIFVAREAASAAAELMPGIMNNYKDELINVDEYYSQGKCPACGADAMNSPNECPDCGLNLGGGGGEGGHDHGCDSGC